MFVEMNERELIETDGGIVFVIAAIVGIAAGVAAVGAGIYEYGKAKGEQAGYKVRDSWENPNRQLIKF